MNRQPLVRSWAHRLCFASVFATSFLAATGLASAGTVPQSEAEASATPVEAIASAAHVSSAQASSDIAVQSAVTPITGAIEAETGDQFAGQWFNLADGKLAIGVTPESSTRNKVNALASAVGVGSDLEYVPVRSTETELQATKALWDSRLAGSGYVARTMTTTPRTPSTSRYPTPLRLRPSHNGEPSLPKGR
ncbi:MAG: hypothetical protein ACYDC2_02965 [Solirubrobacteraceae bacterium]